MGVKLSDLSTETSPASSEIMMIADPDTGIAKKITVSALKTFLDGLGGGGGGGTTLTTPSLSVAGIDADTIRATIGEVSNETGIQLQVSDDGSTGWEDVPGGVLAANTKIFDHNSLPASTTKYYRVRATGDGVTYLTSGWSSVVSASTTGSGPTYLTWSSLGRNAQKNSNRGIYWDGVTSGNVYADAVQTLSAGEEVVCDVPNVVDDVWFFGVHTAQSVDFSSWIYCCRLNVNYIEYESGTLNDTGVTAVVGDLIKIKYSGSTLTIERSTNSGASWSVIATYSGTATGTYYILFQATFDSGPNNIYIQ